MDFSCKTCSRHFKTDKELKNHEKYSHMNTKVFHCNPCNRRFKTDNALKQHEKTSPMHTKAFHCDPCNRSFTCEERLAKHRQQCQVVQKPAPDTVKSFSDQASKMAELSNALARVSILNMPALAVQRHAQTPILESPIATIAKSTALKKTKTKTAKRSKEAKPVTGTKETKSVLMFPQLHERVQQAVFPEITSTWFNEDEDGDYFENEYATYVMGSFTCNNSACGKPTWISGKVYIEIRGFERNGYNALVYNQRCRACDWLGSMVLDEQSYIDRVSYRIKKWADVNVVPPHYLKKPTKKHEQDFCEGCKIWKCERGGYVKFD